MAEYALGLCLSMCPCLREKGGFYIKVGWHLYPTSGVVGQDKLDRAGGFLVG